MISSTLQKQILNRLNLQFSEPSIEFLDQLLYTYTRTIPWESATRNVRRVTVNNIYADCPRWPDEFWELALEHGTGGTCFETNLALYSLLQSLGYDGYLTINNMRFNIGCHTAIVVLIDDKKWLFDAGYPLECLVPIDPIQSTESKAKFLTYQVNPILEDVYVVTRSRHPKPYIFTLFDKPISVEDYKIAAQNDYRPEGNFNNSVVINKIVDEKMVRFSTWPDDVMFESFTADPSEGLAKREVFDIQDNLAAQLASKFSMPAAALQQALDIVSAS
ncbi:MAG: arylamine N-acetyltransferase [Chloroflexota bacterium]